MAGCPRERHTGRGLCLFHNNRLRRANTTSARCRRPKWQPGPRASRRGSGPTSSPWPRWPRWCASSCSTASSAGTRHRPHLTRCRCASWCYGWPMPPRSASSILWRCASGGMPATMACFIGLDRLHRRAGVAPGIRRLFLARVALFGSATVVATRAHRRRRGGSGRPLHDRGHRPPRLRCGGKKPLGGGQRSVEDAGDLVVPQTAARRGARRRAQVADQTSARRFPRPSSMRRSSASRRQAGEPVEPGGHGAGRLGGDVQGHERGAEAPSERRPGSARRALPGATAVDGLTAPSPWPP